MDKEKYVLLVDDDQDIRDLIVEVLRMEDIQVVTGSNGEEAMTRLRENKPPAVILLDLMMPKSDGLWFCAEKEKYPEYANIPVVILSADGKATSKAADLKVAGVLKKPVKIDTILQTVRPFVA